MCNYRLEGWLHKRITIKLGLWAYRALVVNHNYLSRSSLSLRCRCHITLVDTSANQTLLMSHEDHVRVPFSRSLLYNIGCCFLALRLLRLESVHRPGIRSRISPQNCLRKSNCTTPSGKYIEFVYFHIIALNGKMDF